MEKAQYLYRVEHPEHGEVQVEAIDRLRAISGAARIWGVPWTSIARECACERLGEVTVGEGKPRRPAKRKRAGEAGHE